MPQATRLAKFLRSTPAEKEIGNAGAHCFAKLRRKRERDDMQRRAGEIHDLFARLKEQRWFSTSSVLENFAPNCNAARRRQLCESTANCERLVELQAGGVGLFIHAQFGVAHHVVQQMLQPIFAEHRRIHFHNHVDVKFCEQEFANAFDFFGRAAMERGERNAAAECGGVVEVAQRGEPARDLIA